MSLLFVNHDLGVIRFVCDRVAVIYGGQVVETGWVEDVIANPKHRYTNALLEANPGMPKDDNFSAYIGQRLQTISGSVPAVGNFPSGCRFRNRCAYATGPALPPRTGDGRDQPPVFVLESCREGMTVPLVEVSDMSFYYPRASLGPNNEGWTLKNISLDVLPQSTLGVVDDRIRASRPDTCDVRSSASPTALCASAATSPSSRVETPWNCVVATVVFQTARRSLDPGWPCDGR
jgi:oligopeptide/dipeptide ABC transporter ATP-binding protein